MQLNERDWGGLVSSLGCSTRRYEVCSNVGNQPGYNVARNALYSSTARLFVWLQYQVTQTNVTCQGTASVLCVVTDRTWWYLWMSTKTSWRNSRQAAVICPLLSVPSGWWYWTSDYVCLIASGQKYTIKCCGDVHKCRDDWSAGQTLMNNAIGSQTTLPSVNQPLKATVTQQSKTSSFLCTLWVAVVLLALSETTITRAVDFNMFF